MKKNNSVAIGVFVFTVVAIIVIVVSLLNARAPEAPAPTATRTAIPTLASTNTPNPCSVEIVTVAVTEADKITREFQDIFILAQNTPARDLAPTIVELQRIRRTAEDLALPDCLATLKEYQLGRMNSAIDATLVLYSAFSGDPNKTLTEQDVANAVTLVNQHMNATMDFENKYNIEKARLLGVTLPPPTATSTPAVTPSAVTPAP